VQSKAPLAVREITVSLGRSEVKAVVHYFSGDEAWATHIEYLVHHGLPLLEKANGFPYAGPAAIDIVESGYRDTHGYAGSANKQGRIRLTPLVEDQIVLHELSHFWSEPFEPRWLREGMADYTANMVAVQLGAEPDRTPDTIPDAPRLADWQQPRYVSTRVPGLVLDAAGAAIPRDIERAGYIRSLRFVDLLAERAGAEGIARSNAHIADKKAKGDARGYLDALDDVTAKQHADLFAAWILTDADVKMLPARESARKSVALLRGRASPSGFTVPGEVADALARWEFSRALAYSETLSTALDKHRQTATQAHDAGFTLSNGFIHAFSASSESARRYADDEAAAFDAVRSAIAHGRGKHGLLTRVGLVGADLYPPESEAREALARGDHEQAMRSANLIARRIDRAEEDGRWRVGFAGGTILVLAVVATLLLRRRQSARPPRHTAQ
jgi:hypothetical protein